MIMTKNLATPSFPDYVMRMKLPMNFLPQEQCKLMGGRTEKTIFKKCLEL